MLALWSKKPSLVAMRQLPLYLALWSKKATKLLKLRRKKSKLRKKAMLSVKFVKQKKIAYVKSKRKTVAKLQKKRSNVPLSKCVKWQANMRTMTLKPLWWCVKMSLWLKAWLVQRLKIRLKKNVARLNAVQPPALIKIAAAAAKTMVNKRLKTATAA